MASPSPVYFRDFDFGKLHFPSVPKEVRAKAKAGGSDGAAAPSSASGGSLLKVFNVTYGESRAPVLIRFPTVLSTIGLRKNIGDKWTVPLTFTTVDPFGQKKYGEEAGQSADVDPYYPQGELYNFFKDFQEFLQKKVQANCETWLDATSISDKRVAELFNPIVKPHTDKVLGQATGRYPPTASLEVNMATLSTFDITVRDVEKRVLDTSTSTIAGALKGGAHFRGVMLFNGLFFSNNKFTATFTLVYAEQMKPLNITARPTAASFNFAALEDTEDELQAEKLCKRSKMDDSVGAGSGGFSSTSTYLGDGASRPNKYAGAGAGAGAGRY